MIVCFVRHGKAEEKKPGQSDEERKLTEQGRKDIEIVSRVLPVARGSKVYTSPLVRARESAEIIAKELGGSLKVLESLRPELASIETLADVELSGDSVFVGHAPSLERIVSDAIGGGAIKLKAGGAACIDIGNEHRLRRSVGVLVLLVQPDQLRKLYDTSLR
ncbi:MAG: hypothetical protein GXO32_00670 [Crenarchaeota archaeon]|nr:hypothetical protein [Thermoproteota archaeon]